MPPATTSRWISRCRSHASTYGTASAPKPTVRNCRSSVLASLTPRAYACLPVESASRAGPIRVRMPRCVPRRPSSPPPRRSPVPSLGALLALQLGVVELAGAPVAPAGRASRRRRARPGDPRHQCGRTRSPVPVERGPGAAGHGRGARRCCAAGTAGGRGPGRGASRRCCGRSTPPASRAGRRDVALLEQYAERGWSVRGRAPAGGGRARRSTRTSDRVEVRVVERYPDLAVLGRHAARAWGLAPSPTRSEPHVRVVTLVRSPTGWRVERVAAR